MGKTERLYEKYLDKKNLYNQNPSSSFFRAEYLASLREFMFGASERKLKKLGLSFKELKDEHWVKCC